MKNMLPIVLLIVMVGCGRPSKQVNALAENPNNKDDFGNIVAEFTMFKMREVDQLSKEMSLSIDPFVSEFFKGANTISWDTLRDKYWCLTEYAGVKKPPRPIETALIVPVKEAIGTRERWEIWNRDSSLMMELCASILDSMPQNSVFLAGTYEASFSTLAMNTVTKDSKVFCIRQHDLADIRYQKYLQHIYRERLSIPDKDTIADTFMLAVHKLQSGSRSERSAVSKKGKSVQVTGALGVMTVNCAIALKIMELNSADHEFFYEESYPLPQLHPYLEPHGLIMKLNPTKTEITDEMVHRDMQFWSNKVDTLLLNESYLNNPAARRSYFKLRTAIAGLYASKGRSAEAEHAFKQALALCPDDTTNNIQQGVGHKAYSSPLVNATENTLRIHTDE